MARRKFGLMTGGGDAPGLNGIIESTCRMLMNQDVEVIGVMDGFEGFFEGRTRTIEKKELLGLHHEAGTFLGTSNKSGLEGREAEFLAKYNALGIEGLIVAGGDGTFSGLSKIASLPGIGGEKLRILGVPKTIDNDLAGTEITFGFDTACSVVTDAVDDLRATAWAHRRVIIVETMGRTAGWIALGGGLATYSDAILIPERPFNREKLTEDILAKKRNGQRGYMIVVSEGAHAEGEPPNVAFRVDDSPQPERYGGIAERLARWIEIQTGWESRHVVLGHLQRSRRPTTTDRFLTAAMGVEVGRMALEGKWGQAVVYREGKVTRAPITDLMKPARLIPSDHRWIKLAQSLGLFI